MFGFFISRCGSSLGMIAILAKLLTLVACEDIYNSDGIVTSVKDSSSKDEERLIFISNEGVDVTDEINATSNDDDIVTVAMLENTRPKTTGWNEVSSVITNGKDIKIHSNEDYKFINKRYYCLKICLPRNKIYHSEVAMCDNNVLKPVFTIDGKAVQRSRGGNGDGVPIIYRNAGGKKEKSSKTLYIILGAIAILGILLLFAICLTKR